MDAASKPSCPFCAATVGFGELTLGESFAGVARYAFSRVKNPFLAAQEIVGMTASTGTFENYVCESCKGQLHQCGGCKRMLPYKDVIDACPRCGYR